MLHSTLLLSLLTSVSSVSAALSESNLEKHVGALTLAADFNPVKDAYWTGYPHHRRTPFAVSPDGKSAYLAYLDASETDVHIQKLDPSTFAAQGDAVTVTGGKEAGGLVAHNDGFALLTNEALPSGTTDAPADSTPIPVIYRYTSGEQTFKTFLAGPGVHEQEGLSASPDMNGDLAYSEATGMYGAYFVVTAYTGSASGHFGDSIQYVTENGTLETIQGASSTFGCSHNTGIAFEAADSVPFASICAEDQGAIWLNTETQYMSGVKISNENVTNGGGGEAMGGMSGSYSGLARFIDSDSYIFAWVSRGAKDLTTNDWLGSPYTHSINRTNNRNVAIATFSDKNTLNGEEATSELGPDGDSQVNWITTGDADCSNAHVAAFDGSNALVTWEEIAQPQCDFIAMGCKGAFTGSYFQQVDNGEKVGEPVKAMDVYVAGDMVTMPDGRICWPYVDMDWTLDGPVMNAASVSEMSFACMSLDGSSGGNDSSTPSASTSPAAAESTQAPSTPQSSAQAQSSSVKEAAGSSATPIELSTSTAVEPTPSPEVPGSDSDSSLPSFEIVTSGATITPPSSSAAAASTPPVIAPSDSSEAPAFTNSPDVSSPIPEMPQGSALPTETSVNPETSVAPTEPSEAPEAPEMPSSTPCTQGTDATPTPNVPGENTNEAPSSIQLPVEETAPASTPCTKGSNATPTPGSGQDDPLPIDSEMSPVPSETTVPTGAFGGPGYGPRPSAGSPGPLGGWGNGQGHWPEGPMPTGGWGRGPGSGFGFGNRPFGFGPRPSGHGPIGGMGFGGAGKTPCGFETKVRPTATPPAY